MYIYIYNMVKNSIKMFDVQMSMCDKKSNNFTRKVHPIVLL